MGMDRVLVTGGAGFIGSHIVDALVDRGFDVSVVDDLSTGVRLNVNPAAKLHIIDISATSLSRVMDEVRPDVVFHEAAQMNVRRSVADPAFDARVNILGAINLLENCIRVNTKKVIYASSGGCIYGDQAIIPNSEEVTAVPESPYGISKYTVEYYLQYYKKVYNLEFVSLRYANVYGPRQNPLGEAGVIAIFMSKLLNGETPTINGSGRQTRDYVYVKDVVAANMAALKTNVSGAYNVGTSVETNVNELYNAVQKSLNTSIEAVYGPAKPGEQMRSALNIDKAKRELGWTPQYTLEEGLRESAAWFRSEYGRQR